jgi:putative restriction endonuclease
LPDGSNRSQPLCGCLRVRCEWPGVECGASESGAGTLAKDLPQQFEALNIWRNRGKRAPHKPLLALWAIGRCLRGESRLAPYHLVDRELARLLQRFGPHRSSARTDYPFWHMRNDAVWEVDRADLVRTTSKNSAWVRDLKEHAIEGGFTVEVYNELRRDPSLASRIAESLVEVHFPPTLHDAVLDATGVAGDAPAYQHPDLGTTLIRRRRRDPAFRSRILDAYGARCAVCSFAGRLEGGPVAVEAAHIRWHMAKGPPVIQNGLALCALHHELFDEGAFTILPGLKVVVAGAVGGDGMDAALGRYHQAPLLAPPRRKIWQPDPAFLKWHASEVFKKPAAVL